MNIYIPGYNAPANQRPIGVDLRHDGLRVSPGAVGVYGELVQLRCSQQKVHQAVPKLNVMSLLVRKFSHNRPLAYDLFREPYIMHILFHSSGLALLHEGGGAGVDEGVVEVQNKSQLPHSLETAR